MILIVSYRDDRSRTGRLAMNERGSDSAGVARWSGAQWWLLIVSCMAVALVVAPMAALYSALPQIAVATGATQAQLIWIVDGYTLVLAYFVVPAGAIGDRSGPRPRKSGG